MVFGFFKFDKNSFHKKKNFYTLQQQTINKTCKIGDALGGILKKTDVRL